jgi:hypothetical protein
VTSLFKLGYVSLSEQESKSNGVFQRAGRKRPDGKATHERLVDRRANIPNRALATKGAVYDRTEPVGQLTATS